MCQHCVEAGRYTQEEYDQRILDGDTNVMPMMDMDIEKVIETLESMAADAVRKGLSPAIALEVARGMLDDIMDEQAERDRSLT